MISWKTWSRCSVAEKIQTLYEHGTFIMAIRYYRYKVNLYLLGDSYVEVFVNHKLAAIEKIDLLDSSHTRMKFYSDQIKLPQELASKRSE
jgi:hypothetical protein